MRYLGIDYGTKRVGVALSDENGKMAFAHSVIPNLGKEKTARKIKKNLRGKFGWENSAGQIFKLQRRTEYYNGENRTV